MSAHYQHLGVFSDLVAVAQKAQPLFPQAVAPLETRQRIRELLAFSSGSEAPLDVRTEHSWEADGLVGEQVTWSVGYGPRTAAWVLRPAGVAGPLPGVIALHDHGHFKLLGKEKIADGPERPLADIVAFRRRYYDGRAFANAMAREGFIVLVPDAFLWGSRAFPIETLPETDRLLAPALGPLISEPGTSEPAAHYNAGAVFQEHIIAKYCTILGTSITALVSYEDRMAAAYLRSRNDVMGERMGCVGLSGGGCRAALLQATDDSISAAVVAGMMCTYAGLLDHDVALHTWMFFPPGLSRVADWPDLAASRAPSPLLVQYALDDDLFTVEGMRAADARIGAFYESVDARGNYRGEFYPGPHRFDCAMQNAAFAWLRAYLTA